jgi:hypothetical protein
MSDTTPEKGGFIGNLSRASWVEPLLGALVAVFGIMTAWAAFTAGMYGGNSAEAYFIALRDLTSANDAYGLADRTVATDNSVISDYFINSEFGVSEETLDVLFRSLSDEADAAWTRYEEDPDAEDFLDDQYYEEMYGYADELSENSNVAFKIAKQWDDLGDQYEFLGLLLALGLGFAAWASLLSTENIVRYLFAVLAIGILIWSAVVTFQLVSTPTPAEVTALSIEE